MSEITTIGLDLAKNVLLLLTTAQKLATAAGQNQASW